MYRNEENVSCKRLKILSPHQKFTSSLYIYIPPLIINSSILNWYHFSFFLYLYNLHDYFLTRSTRNNDPFCSKKKENERKKGEIKFKPNFFNAQKRARPPRYTLCRYLETASGLHLAANIVCKPTARAREKERKREGRREGDGARTCEPRARRERERERDREA